MSAAKYSQHLKTLEQEPAGKDRQRMAWPKF